MQVACTDLRSLITVRQIHRETEGRSLSTQFTTPTKTTDDDALRAWSEVVSPTKTTDDDAWSEVVPPSSDTQRSYLREITVREKNPHANHAREKNWLPAESTIPNSLESRLGYAKRNFPTGYCVQLYNSFGHQACVCKVVDLFFFNPDITGTGLYLSHVSAWMG